MEELESRSYGDVVVEAYPQHGIAVLALESVKVTAGRTDETAHAIEDAARELGGSGFRKLVAPHVSTTDTDLVRCLKRVGFSVRLAMLRFECDLPRATTDREPVGLVLPAELTSDDLTGVSRAGLETAFLQCFPDEDAESTINKTVDVKSFLGHASFFAGREDEVVGFTLVRATSCQAAYVAYQGTVPEWRRRGVGSYLLWRSVAAVTELGFLKLVGDQVFADNTAVIRVLRKCRFEEVAKQLNMSLDLQKLA